MLVNQEVDDDDNDDDGVYLKKIHCICKLVLTHDNVKTFFLNFHSNLHHQPPLLTHIFVA